MSRASSDRCMWAKLLTIREVRDKVEFGLLEPPCARTCHSLSFGSPALCRTVAVQGGTCEPGLRRVPCDAIGTDSVNYYFPISQILPMLQRSISRFDVKNRL